MKRTLYLLRLAVSFLTPLPLGGGMYQGGDLARASVFFPLVGLGIGGAVWGVRLAVFSRTEDALLASLLALFFWVVLTRGLHLDGVADVCDALFGGGEEARRREILKDPRVGTFGVLGVIFVLGAKGVALFRPESAFALFLAPAFGRAVALLFGAFFSPFPREEPGLGEEFLGKVPKMAFLGWGGGLCVVLFLAGGWTFALKTAAGFGIMFTLGKVLSQSFGGLNGDALGAGIEWGEALWLLLLRV